MSEEVEAPSGEETRNKPLFPNINADDEDQAVTEMESLCLNCHEQGMTRLLLTKIPFFKEVVISSFSCEECGYSNTGIQSGGQIQEKGVRYTITVSKAEDLDRQVIKGEGATFLIPELEFEQPRAQKGDITTVEGLIDGAINGLEMFLPQRRVADPEMAEKLDVFLAKLKKLKDLETQFKLILDDPAGNSFVENPFAPKKDQSMTVVHYKRSHQQDVEIGIAADDQEEEEPSMATVEEEPEDGDLDLTKEVVTFKTNCSECSAPCDTNMKVLDIPYFKQVVIMATNCDACGYRENEVKGGAGIADKGTRISLRLTNTADLSRDLLKSDTCALQVPELELDMEEGTLGGKFTTVEGLLRQVREQLTGQNSFVSGDSGQHETKQKLKDFCDKLDKVISGESLGVHFVLNDPTGNSYLQNVYAPDEDPEMTIEHYERTHEQNEMLGLNDMKTENYTTEES